MYTDKYNFLLKANDTVFALFEEHIESQAYRYKVIPCGQPQSTSL
jgi:hypothetical protein